MALWVHFPFETKVSLAVVTLGVTTCAILTAYTRVYHSMTTFLGNWIVGQFAAEWVDKSSVAEEEAGVVGKNPTALCVIAANSSDNVSLTAFKVKV